jgi:rhamnose transport system permease protein
MVKSGSMPEVALWNPKDIGLVLGCLNGLVIGFLELPAIIVTLGTMSIYRGVTFIISGSDWIIQKDLAPTGFRSIALGDFLGVTSIVWIALFLSLAAGLFLRYVRLGRTLFAIGSHKKNAGLIGIDIPRTVLFVYATDGTLFGLTGLLLASRHNFAQNSLGAGYEMTIIASAVIRGTSVNGGRGSVVGVVVGAFLLSFIVNASNVLKISPFWKMAIQGVIILVAVIIDSWLSKKRA